MALQLLRLKEMVDHCDSKFHETDASLSEIKTEFKKFWDAYNLNQDYLNEMAQRFVVLGEDFDGVQRSFRLQNLRLARVEETQDAHGKQIAKNTADIVDIKKDVDSNKKEIELLKSRLDGTSLEQPEPEPNVQELADWISLAAGTDIGPWLEEGNDEMLVVGDLKVKHIRCLLPGIWMGDMSIEYFFKFLAARDVALHGEATCYFLKPQFITWLLNRDDPEYYRLRRLVPPPPRPDRYEYSKVQKWTQST